MWSVFLFEKFRMIIRIKSFSIINRIELKLGLNLMAVYICISEPRSFKSKLKISTIIEENIWVASVNFSIDPE